MKEKAFNNWRHNAIHLTFPNGNSLSTTWGYGSYSEGHNELNKERSAISLESAYHKFVQSDNVEIMILEAPEKLVKKIHKKFDFDDDVKGYVTMTEWLEIVKMLSK